MEARLILEDGTVFKGTAFGNLEDSIGEVVFNTGMTGYGELLTDPSYYGQIVVMTYPLIGNYGINLDDFESTKCHVKGFVVREKTKYPNNFRCEMDLDTYLKNQGIIGIEGIDTRALTKIIRNAGTMRGIITTVDIDESNFKTQIESFKNDTAIEAVSTKKIEEIDGRGLHVLVWDFGVKENIIREFKKRNCKITKVPYDTKAKEILDINPDLIFLSNGPGNPADLGDVISNIKELVGKFPIGGICLGHQLLSWVFEGTTSKLKFGHRGGNHPVKDFEQDRVYITSQNHGYYVDNVPRDMVVTHRNMNDDTVEGMRHKNLPIYSVQFHPEACPGPEDNTYIFDNFLDLVTKKGGM